MTAKHNQRVAIVVPQHRFPLSADEEVSLRHLRTHLGNFDRFLIGPTELPSGFSDFRLCRFPSHFFQSEHSYNKLLLTRDFYRAFQAYEYILIYQLDCLVFSEDLEQWCNRGWDYVGAPWFRGSRDDVTGGFWAVGNGGLSLRHVARSLKALSPGRRVFDPSELGQRTRYLQSWPKLRTGVCWLKTWLHRCGYKNTVRWYIREFSKDPHMHEDIFWSIEVPRYFPDFSIPTPQKALPFSFECAPSYCFQHNKERLPFGCHAWAKWDRTFWEPYLLK